MHILGLAGRKKSTEAHLRALVEILDIGQTRVTLQHYGFWDGAVDHPNPDVVPEAQAAARSGADIVIAKSIGTLVTLVAHAQYAFVPGRAVFIGTPLKRYQAEKRVDALRQFAARVPTLFIQQTNDPNGAYAVLASLLAKDGCTVAEIPGDDHEYGDAARLKRCIEEWYAKPS